MEERPNSHPLVAYTMALGKVIVNLQSLEITLRLFLQCQAARANPEIGQVKVAPLKIGQQVPIDHFSSYDSLSELIQKFNESIQPADTNSLIDKQIVELRDALAHGRIWGSNPYPPFHIVKFAKPKGRDTSVAVTFSETISIEWLATQTLRILREVGKVWRAGSALYPENFPKPEPVIPA